MGTDSPIRHLASIVCPPWMDRDKVIFVMLSFAFDAGGDDATPVLTVGGFASSVKDWDDFSLQWKTRLAQDKIDFFRAVDAAHFRGPFQHWHGLPNRDDLRNRLFQDLMEIIKRNVYRKFGCTIVNSAFRHMDKALAEEYAMTAYSVAGRRCELTAREWVIDEWKGTEIVELVFEDGDAGKGKLIKRLEDDGCFSPTFKPKKDTMRNGVLQYGFIPLQAGDWLAYELSLAVAQFESGKRPAAISELRWPMQEFLRIHGNTGVVVAENIEELERKVRLSKELDTWWSSLNL